MCAKLCFIGSRWNFLFFLNINSRISGLNKVIKGLLKKNDFLANFRNSITSYN